MLDYVYTDHAQYTIKTYAKMALFPLLLTGPLSIFHNIQYQLVLVGLNVNACITPLHARCMPTVVVEAQACSDTSD